ncbi:MAG: hypothetical protein NVSMB64_28970 [Candidatus Velthaea sp.]
MAKRVYWDACAWIGLINKEATKYDACRYTMDEAEKGVIEIWTSAFTLAEVFKKKCDAATASGLSLTYDSIFEDYLLKDHIVLVGVDREVGTYARKLLRAHLQLKKPQDAIHLATAALNDVDEFHTYDNTNILPLDGLIDCRGGAKLQIKKPDDPPPPTPTLFALP